MDVTVERLAARHIDGVCRIENACFSEPWSRGSLSALPDDANAVFFVAVSENEPVGYGGFYVAADIGAIANIGVLQEFRRKGIGERLLNALVEEAKAKRLVQLQLEVRASNGGAIALYRKAGFQKCGVRRNFYRKPTEDAELWNLDLPHEGRSFT